MPEPHELLKLSPFLRRGSGGSTGSMPPRRRSAAQLKGKSQLFVRGRARGKRPQRETEGFLAVAWTPGPRFGVEFRMHVDFAPLKLPLPVAASPPPRSIAISLFRSAPAVALSLCAAFCAFCFPCCMSGESSMVLPKAARSVAKARLDGSDMATQPRNMRVVQDVLL